MSHRVYVTAVALSLVLFIFFAAIWGYSRVALGGAACAIGHEFIEIGTQPDLLVIIWAKGWPTPQPLRFFSLKPTSRTLHPVFRSIESVQHHQLPHTDFSLDAWTAQTPVNPDGSALWKTPAQSALSGQTSELSAPLQFHGVSIPFLLPVWVTILLPLMYANQRYRKNRRNKDASADQIELKG